MNINRCYRVKKTLSQGLVPIVLTTVDPQFQPTTLACEDKISTVYANQRLHFSLVGRILQVKSCMKRLDQGYPIANNKDCQQRPISPKPSFGSECGRYSISRSKDCGGRGGVVAKVFCSTIGDVPIVLTIVDPQLHFSSSATLKYSLPPRLVHSHFLYKIYPATS